MEKIQLIGVFFIFQNVFCAFNRPVETYQQITSYIHNYYKCDSIILLGGALNEKCDVMTSMVSLQLYFRKLNQPITIAKKGMKLNGIENFRKASKPIVVFFDDFDDVKFQLVASALDVWKPIFLFFVNDLLRAEDLFSNVYFPYEYEFIISQKNELNQNQEIISQIKLDNKRKTVIKSLFAEWSKVTGIKSFAVTEESLSGQILRAAIIPIPPNLKVEKVNGEMKITGLLIEIAETLESEMNFKFAYTLVDRVGLEENGTWSGGLGLLVENSVDVFFTILVLSPERYDSFDLSYPLQTAKLGMYIKKPSTFSWNNYFKPLNILVWGAIILTIIITSGAYTFLEYFKKINVIRRLRKKQIKLSINYGDSFFNVFGAMCNQGLELSPFRPLRILQFTIHFTSLLISTFYSAVFLSLITVPVFRLPITSFKDLLEDGSYKLGCLKAHEWTIFQQSDDEIMKKIFHTHIITQNPPPPNYIDGIKHLCKNDKYALIVYDTIVLLYSSSKCPLLLVEHVIGLKGGIAFQNNSPYTKIFNKQFFKMWESGILEKINQKYLPSNKKIQESWAPIDELEIVAIIVILLGCMFFSIILLLLEIFVHRKISKQNKNLIWNG